MPAAAAATDSLILPDIEEAPRTVEVVLSPPTPPLSSRALLDPQSPELSQQPDMETVRPPRRKDPNPSSSSRSIDWKNINKEIMSSLLSTKEGFKSVTHVEGPDAIIVADFLDIGIDSQTLSVKQQKLYRAALRKLCSKAVILPTSHTITDELKKTGDHPNAGGGFAEVWEGTYKGEQVAIKALKVYQKDDMDKVKKRFYKEALVWKHLNHPNVLTFLGVKVSRVEFWLVSPWMMGGNLDDYVISNPEADRFLLFRCIMNGLGYLHSHDVVHGDLKGPNILIRGADRACLADFGLTTIITETIPGYSMSSNRITGGTARWMAPELLSEDTETVPPGAMQELTVQPVQSPRSVPSKQSDIYALGMVVFEVITGTIPLNEYNNVAVINKVIGGLRPKRPQHVSVVRFVEKLWPIAEECWREKREDRPTIHQVQELFDPGSGSTPQDSISHPLLASVDNENDEISDSLDPLSNTNQPDVELPQISHDNKPTRTTETKQTTKSPVQVSDQTIAPKVVKPEKTYPSQYQAAINDADNSKKQGNGSGNDLNTVNEVSSPIKNEDIPKSVEPNGVSEKTTPIYLPQEEKGSSCGCCVIQ